MTCSIMEFKSFTGISDGPPEADKSALATIMNVPDQDRQGIVTLSAAKGLSLWAHRCFAEFTLSEACRVPIYRARGSA
jgi:hypothetical protein